MSGTAATLPHTGDRGVGRFRKDMATGAAIIIAAALAYLAYAWLHRPGL